MGKLSTVLTVVGLLAPAARAQVSVLTQHNDTQRSGANLNETILNTSNVNVSQFGKLFVRSVDGQIYAQPLVASPNINGSTVNVVYVTTENNSVYAFDADTTGASSPIWHVNLGTPVPSSAICTSDLYPQIGITSTPVIDPASGTLYVEAKTSDSTGYHHTLYALDMATGAKKASVAIQAFVSGTGAGNSNGIITFDALHQLNRPGLLLANGLLYLAFGSHCDVNPYHGWVMSYDPGTLVQKAVFNDTPNDTRGGIWQAGQGLSTDSSGYIYLMTGNGGFDYPGGPDLGDSFLKLDGTSLGVLDYFAPSTQASLSANDLDLGGAGPLILPPSLPSAPAMNMLISGGKGGVLYLVNRDSMGHYNSTDNVLEEWQVSNGPILGSPVLWNEGGANGQYWLYLWPSGDQLKQFQWSNGSFATTPVFQGTATGQFPGGILALSSNGSGSGTGILWATSTSSSANHATVPGVLHAYDASNVSKELWNSYQNQSRDDFGSLAKFCPPTIANGKVYMATFSNQLVVYGLLPTSDTQPPTAPTNLNVTSTTRTSVALQWSASTDNVGVVGYYIYRTVQGKSGLAGTSSTTTFTDSPLQPNTNYSYYVKAFDAAGNVSAASNTVKAKTQK